LIDQQGLSELLPILKVYIMLSLRAVNSSQGYMTASR
jgi:hypothetical protein